MRKKSEAHPAHFTLGFPSFGCSWRPAAPRRYLAGAPDHQPGGDHDGLGRTLPAVQPGEEQPGRGPAERRRILSHDRDGRIEQSASWTSSKPTRAIRRWAPSRRRPRTAPMLIRFWAVNSAVGGHGEQLDHGLQRLVATPDIPPYESPGRPGFGRRRGPPGSHARARPRSRWRAGRPGRRFCDARRQPGGSRRRTPDAVCRLSRCRSRGRAPGGPRTPLAG